MSWIGIDIIFQSPWMLLLLIGVPYLLWKNWRQELPKSALIFSSMELLPMITTWKVKTFRYAYYLRFVALTCLILAIARPVLPLKEELIEAESIEIAMVIDLSSSMLAQDFQPDRLEASKEVAKEFIGNRPYDLFSIIAFAAESYTLSPLTSDRDILKKMIDDLQCGMLEDGTAIGMGLANAINRLKDGKASSKIVVLLTDGVSNIGYIQPLTAASMAMELDIKVYTIGIGSMGEALSPVSRRADGRYIYGYTRVEIDEDLLREISKMTGGKYFRATDNLELRQIYNEIDRLEKTKIDLTVIKTFKDLYHWFLLAGLVLIFIEQLIREMILKPLPR